MNLTAQQAREIVAQSHIYKLIGEKASEGEMSMTIAYMTPEMFRMLSRNGFRVFTKDETAEFKYYDEELMNTCDFFVVSREVY